MIARAPASPVRASSSHAPWSAPNRASTTCQLRPSAPTPPVSVVAFLRGVRVQIVMRIGVVCMLLSAVSAVPAAARDFAFKSPTGNLTCVISTSSGGFAQCEDRSRPRGGGASVSRSGRVTRYDVDGHDDLADNRFVLRYGRSTRLSGFRCTSRESGMTCSYLPKRHGFTMSRGRTVAF